MTDEEMAVIQRAAMWAVRRCRVPDCLREDAMQEARMGAWMAATHFDLARGCSLRTFAQRRATGAVLDFLRGEDTVSRSHRRLIKREEAEPVRRVGVGALAGRAVAADQAELVLRREVMELTGKLSPRTRAALIGWMAGRKLREDAEASGASEVAIAMRRYVAIRRLREMAA